MNFALRKRIHRRNQLRNKFWRIRNSKDWENYRKIKSLTNKTRKQSEVKYFRERSQTNTNATDFFKYFKPYLSDKSHTNTNFISYRLTLKVNDEVISQPEKVGGIFKEHYEIIANDIKLVSLIIL